MVSVTVSISPESYRSDALAPRPGIDRERVELDRRFGEIYICRFETMDATRARVSSLVEWLVALACLLALMAAGSMLSARHQQRDRGCAGDRP